MTELFSATYKWARRCAIALVGGTVVVIGVMMIVLPGPAIVVIPAGLAILSIEFACAKRWLQHVRRTGDLVLDKLCFWKWKRHKSTATQLRLAQEPPVAGRRRF